MKPLVFLVAAAGLVAAQGLPKGAGAEIYEAVCGGCHGADIVIGASRDRDAWADTVQRMRDRGATGSDDEFKVVMDYLVRNFGPKTAAAPAKPATDAFRPPSLGWKRIFMPWTWF